MQRGRSTLEIRRGSMHPCQYATGSAKSEKATQDSGQFRVQLPKRRTGRLPSYLSETDYRRLEATIRRETDTDTYHARFDRAPGAPGFLTLAHSGVRIIENLIFWRDFVPSKVSRYFKTHLFVNWPPHD